MKYVLHQPENAALSVRQVDGADGPASEVWLLEWDGAEGPSPLDLAQELLDTALTMEEGPPPFTLERRQSYFEWGASGATETIILSVLGAAAYDLLKAQLRVLIDKVSERSTHDSPSRRITKEEAVERSRWRAHSMFGIEWDDLELRAVSQIGDHWIVAFRHDDSEYEMKLSIDEGYPLIIQAAMKRVD